MWLVAWNRMDNGELSKLFIDEGLRGRSTMIVSHRIYVGGGWTQYKTVNLEFLPFGAGPKPGVIALRKSSGVM